MIKISIKNY